MKPYHLAMLVGMVVSGSAWADAAALMSITNPVPEGGAAFRVIVSGFAADDFVPVRRVADHWAESPDPHSGRNLAIGFGRLEASQQWGGWTIGAYRRLDAFGETTDSTVRVYHEQQSDPAALLARSGRYDLNYAFRGFSAEGLRLSWSPAEIGDSLRAGVAINLLKSGFLRSERVSGTASSANGVATVRGRRELLYSGLDYTPPEQADLNDFSPPSRQNPDGGWGYAFDLGLRWTPREDLRVSLAVNDLFGSLCWRNVPKLIQEFNDASWPLQFNVPTETAKITGRNSYERYSLRLKPKLASEIEWTKAAWSLGAGVSAIRGAILTEASVGYRLSGSSRLGVSYEPRFGSAGLEFRGGPVYVSLRSDRLRGGDARAFGLSAGFVARF